MIKIDKNIVQKITWEQDPNTFDRRLHASGCEHDEFIVVNPKYDPWILDYIDPKEIASDKCVVWAIDNLWLVKKFKKSWTEAKGWDLVHCELDIEKTVKFNPDVKFINTSLRNTIENYKINIEDAASEHVWYTEDRVWIARAVATEFEITGSKDMGVLSVPLVYNPALPDVDFDIAIDLPYFHYDYNYELVWYLDDKFNNDGVKIWVAKFLPDASQGVKDMGYVQPVIEYNSYIPVEEFDGITAPYQDLVYEHVWYLDPGFTYLGDKIWAARITPRNSQGYKEKGYIKPKDYAGPVMEYNPAIPRVEFDFSRRVVYHDLNYDLIWYLDPNYVEDSAKVWAVKIASVGPSKGIKDMGYVGPTVEYNKDVPRFDIEADTNATYIDFDYELVWYLDPKFNFDHEKIWVKRIQPLEAKGVKDMGYIRPVIEYNPDIPKVNFDVDISVPYQDLIYDHVWHLDHKFNPFEDQVWAIKLNVSDSHGLKTMGSVSPVIKRNPAIPNVNLVFDEVVPYYEFKNNIIWYIDSRFNPIDEKIWALRIDSLELDAGLKEVGTARPEIVYNPDIPKLDYYIDDHIPYYDLGYEHVWMLDDNLHTDKEKIWAAKIIPNGEKLGVKEVGNIGVRFSPFDVIFISYHEPNAEANWQRLLETCPTAKRIKNVKGIFEAHKAAAELATTEMFYVVDGDAELVDNWRFDYKPNVFNMDCVHLWTSINPINDLEYGWGGVKLFPRKLLLDATSWQVDLTTGLGKLVYFPKISNVNTFNTDPFNTWRSAFRECAKLSSSLHQGATTITDSEYRLQIWNTVGEDRPYGKYAIDGARLGTQFGLENFKDLKKLKLINDYDWMKNEFNEFYKQQ